MRIVRTNTTITLIIKSLIIQTIFRQFRLYNILHKALSEYVRIRKRHTKNLTYCTLQNLIRFFHSDTPLHIKHCVSNNYRILFRQFRQFVQINTYKPHRIKSNE